MKARPSWNAPRRPISCWWPGCPRAPQLTTSGVPSSDFGGGEQLPGGRVQKMLDFGTNNGRRQLGTLPPSSPDNPADSFEGVELLPGGEVVGLLPGGERGPKNVGFEEIE